MREVICEQSAREILLEGATPSVPERVKLGEAGGRVAAVDVLSPVDLPLFENSAMDGFAVSSIDVSRATTRRPVTLEIIGESRAGHPSGQRLSTGQAMGISTGAMLPVGADSVLRSEDVAREADWLTVTSPVSAGRDVRHQGETARVGDCVVRSGVELGSIELGALATVGRGHVICHRRPRVALLQQRSASRDPHSMMGAVAQIAIATIAESGAELVEGGPIHVDQDPAVEAGRKEYESDLTLVCSTEPAAGPGPIGSTQVDFGTGRPDPWPVRRAWIMRFGEVRILGLPDETCSAEVALRLLVRPTLRALSGIGGKLASKEVRTPDIIH